MGADREAIFSEAWNTYFTRPGGGPCKRHGWQDAEGGLCPSCAGYAVGHAAAAAERHPRPSPDREAIRRRLEEFEEWRRFILSEGRARALGVILSGGLARALLSDERARVLGRIWDHAPDDLRALLDEVERLERERDEAGGNGEAIMLARERFAREYGVEAAFFDDAVALALAAAEARGAERERAAERAAIVREVLHEADKQGDYPHVYSLLVSLASRIEQGVPRTPPASEEGARGEMTLAESLDAIDASGIVRVRRD